jgi:hypothetical protein
MVISDTREVDTTCEPEQLKDKKKLLSRTLMTARQLCARYAEEQGIRWCVARHPYVPPFRTRAAAQSTETINVSIDSK